MSHLRHTPRCCSRCFSSTSTSLKFIAPPSHAPPPKAFGIQPQLLEHAPVDYAKPPLPPPRGATPQTAIQLAQAQARAKAWYLPQTAPPPPKRQPIFTTFDPSRTSPILPSEIIIKPLPPNAPVEFRALHRFLTEECGDVIDVGSVVFLHTPSAYRGNVGEGDIIVNHGEGDVRGGEEVGGRWNWVVSAEVKGIGKGVIGRADRYIRLWLHRNPLYANSDSVVRYTGEGRPKLPRVREETDWSMIPVREGQLCVNLFTPDGRDRWNLEGLYGTTSERGSRRGWEDMGGDVRGLL